MNHDRDKSESIARHLVSDFVKLMMGEANGFLRRAPLVLTAVITTIRMSRHERNKSKSAARQTNRFGRIVAFLLQRFIRSYSRRNMSVIFFLRLLYSPQVIFPS